MCHQLRRLCPNEHDGGRDAEQAHHELHGAAGLAWDPFLDALAEHHTVYAPEHPGTTVGDPDSVDHLDNLCREFTQNGRCKAY